MPTESFLDTNLLVYAAYPASGEEWKQDIALDLMQRERFAVSSQVLLEFLNITTRKRKPGLPLEEARKWLMDFCASEVVAVDQSIVGEAVDLAIRYKIVFWDGAIIAAANRAGATTLFTEDLNNGQKYGSVQVINPFKPTPH
jgi:predicted nucleic acid-binding protein